MVEMLSSKHDRKREGEKVEGVVKELFRVLYWNVHSNLGDQENEYMGIGKSNVKDTA